MALAAAPHPEGAEFVIEDIITGVCASGFGHLGDGRTFAFHVRRGALVVEVYRPRLSGPVPVPEDVVARGHRAMIGLDVDDARSLTAAVRDAIAAAEPVSRLSR